MNLDLPQPIHDLLFALWSSPAVFFIILGLNIFGVMLQHAPLFPNRFNYLIPWLLMVIGIIFTILLVPKDIFPATQQNPNLLLGIIGFGLGFAAWMIHTYPIQWATTFLTNKFGHPAPPAAEPPKV